MIDKNHNYVLYCISSFQLCKVLIHSNSINNMLSIEFLPTSASYIRSEQEVFLIVSVDFYSVLSDCKLAQHCHHIITVHLLEP